MADVRSLIADPDFAKLDPASQRQALARVSGDQAFTSLSDDDLSSFRTRMGGAAPLQAQAPPQAPTFGSEIWQQLGQPIVDSARKFARDPIGVSRLGAGRDMVQGVFNQASLEGLRTWQALAGQGEFQGMGPVSRASEATGHAMAGALPVFGPAASHAATNLSQGHYGAFGADLISLAASLDAPELGEATAAPLEAAAPGLYRGAIRYPKALSLSDMASATRMGLEEGLPVRSEASLKSVGGVNQAGTIMGDISKQIDDILNTNGVGNQMVDLKTATAPLKDAIVRAKRDTTLEGQQYAKALQDELDAWQKQNQSLTVHAANDQKKALYDRISESTYADNSNAIPTASRVAKEQIARGLMQSVNEKASGVQSLNNQLGSMIDLRQALTDELKRNSNGFKDNLVWALGGASTAALLTQHEQAGLLGLLAASVRGSLQSPAIRSRLAISFSRSPEILKAIGYGAQASAITSQPWQHLQVQPPQQ